MRISIVICTLNRPHILHQTVLSVMKQSLQPRQIVISSPPGEHVLGETLALPGVEFVLSPIGASKQRNSALDRISPESELVAFLDDDIELATSYMAEMARLFSTNPAISIASGRLLHDGGRSTRIERETAVRLCETYDAQHDPSAPLRYEHIDSGYGCNMLVRVARMGAIRFDERLPLYSWLEDRDFSHRCTLGGALPVQFENAVAVHLGWRSGRTSGVRLGFSTVVNPVYLKRKHNTFSLGYIVVHYWCRCLFGNILGLVTGDREYDRLGLLKGNFLGYRHLLAGKCDPEHILNL